VWITGGGSGIGRALAIEYARQGYHVGISGRREEKLREVSQEVERVGTRCVCAPCDVTREKSVQDALATVTDTLGRIDVAIANAGFGIVAPFGDITFEQWSRQVDVNLLGVISTLKAALPEVKKTKGRLAVISSVAGKIGLANNSAYCATKSALVGLCNSLYTEFSGSGVSITNVLPGMIQSQIAMVDNDGVFHKDRKDRRPKKLIWPADKAAKAIYKAIHARRREAVITGHGKLAAFLGQHLGVLTYPVMAKLSLSRRSKKPKSNLTETM